MKSSEKLCWVYMTAGSLEEAKNIGQKLVEQNLVACVNFLENTETEVCSILKKRVSELSRKIDVNSKIKILD